MTPFQRMVVIMEAERQHEEAEKQSGSQQGGRRMNSHAHAGGKTVSGDTTTYINEGVN
jgi:hypothetical protein